MAAQRTSDGSEEPPAAPEATEVIHLVVRFGAFFQRARSDMPPPLRAAFDEHRLGPRHAAVLIQLLPGEPMSVTALADRVGSAVPTVSELVGDLQRAGMVAREVDPTDRRRNLISVPDRHRAEYKHFLAHRCEPLLRALRQLDPEQRAGFISGLRLWAAEIEPVPSRSGC